MKKTILVDAITFFFILLFLYTGVAKLLEIHTIKEQMLSSPFLNSPFLAAAISWVLPIGEILLAIALFIPRWHIIALYTTCVLMTLFTLYVIVILLIDSQISCSCGGIIEELSPKQHVIFNSSCVLLCVLAIAIQRKEKPDRRFAWITRSSIIGLFLLVGWIVFAAFTRPALAKTGMEGRLLPSFDIRLQDSVTVFNTASIPAGKPFIIIGFAPWCKHCQAETRDILAHIGQFKNINIYYVTLDDFSLMKHFYHYFQLNKYPNITVGKETKEVFFSYFKSTTIPYSAIFDGKKRLKTVFIHQTTADKLAQALPN